MLAAWGTAYLQGAVSLDDAVHHVIGEGTAQLLRPIRQEQPVHDEVFAGLLGTPLPPVYNVELVPSGEYSRPLSWSLTDLRSAGIARLSAIFPAPGDIAGLPHGPVSRAALDAGEAVALNDAGLILVPSVDDPHDTSWQPYEAVARIDYTGLGEAQFELTEEVARSTQLLQRLDVATWNPEYARISRDALDSAYPDLLPRSFPQRATSLLQRASGIAAILDVADRDVDGGTANSHEARARAEALTPLHRVVRRALTACYNAAPHS